MNNNLLREYTRSIIQEINFFDTVDAHWLAMWLIDLSIYIFAQLGQSVKRSNSKIFFKASEPSQQDKIKRALKKLQDEGFSIGKTKDRYVDKDVEILSIETHFPQTDQQFTLYVIHLKRMFSITAGGKETEYAFAVTSNNNMNIADAVKRLKDIY